MAVPNSRGGTRHSRPRSLAIQLARQQRSRDPHLGSPPEPGHVGPQNGLNDSSGAPTTHYGRTGLACNHRRPSAEAPAVLGSDASDEGSTGTSRHRGRLCPRNLHVGPDRRGLQRLGPRRCAAHRQSSTTRAVRFRRHGGLMQPELTGQARVVTLRTALTRSSITWWPPLGPRGRGDRSAARIPPTFPKAVARVERDPRNQTTRPSAAPSQARPLRYVAPVDRTGRRA